MISLAYGMGMLLALTRRRVGARSGDSAADHSPAPALAAGGAR